MLADRPESLSSLRGWQALFVIWRTMRAVAVGIDQTALIDDEDYELVSQFRWRPLFIRHGGNNLVYAVNHCGGRRVLMHRLIMKAPKGIDVDHINGNGLDNQRTNMRAATRAQNIMNSALRKDNTSGFKGVSFERGEWQSKARLSGKTYRLGRFKTPEEAASAYDQFALQHFGEFARTNAMLGLI